MVRSLRLSGIQSVTSVFATMNSGSENMFCLQEISATAIGDTPPFGSLMLPDDDPRVVDVFNKLESRKMSTDDIKKSLTDGASWHRSHSKHQAARKQLGKRLQLEAGQQDFNLVW